MTDAVVFKTAGLLDLRSLTIMGVNAKPNSASPIGYFGTGLKYAIAVLAREKIPVTIFIGPREYKVQTVDTQFRDKDIQQIELVLQGTWLFKNRITLPFTTELGKNWKLWQAFRELESNTRDEQGMTWTDSDRLNYFPEVNNTKIYVEGEAFLEQFHRRDEIFLPDALTLETELTGECQIFQNPSEWIYYRGVRIYKPRKPTLNTYNVLGRISLTEDRTAAYEWELNRFIMNTLIRSEDRALIKSVLKASDKAYEHGFDWSWADAPAKAFLEELKYAHRHRSYSGAYIRDYAERYVPDDPEAPEPFEVEKLIGLIEDHNWVYANEYIGKHREAFFETLRLGEEARHTPTSQEPPETIYDDAPEPPQRDIRDTKTSHPPQE